MWALLFAPRSVHRNLLGMGSEVINDGKRRFPLRSSAATSRGTKTEIPPVLSIRITIIAKARCLRETQPSTVKGRLNTSFILYCRTGLHRNQTTPHGSLVLATPIAHTPLAHEPLGSDNPPDPRFDNAEDLERCMNSRAHSGQWTEAGLGLRMSIRTIRLGLR